MEECSEENKCIGKEENENCHEVIDCMYPYTCIDNKCQGLRNIGESCTKDTDCVFQAGCLNGKCTRYFSLNDGEPIDQKTFKKLFLMMDYHIVNMELHIMELV